ncbi:MAG: hypothetical protein EPO68_17445 [Planctomycetota bacterium]|nr:MAG: hypothetical protein EPO68_17445 [Planctomycetota bacterium]
MPTASLAGPTLAYLRTEMRTVSDGRHAQVTAFDLFELRNETDVTWVYTGWDAVRPLAGLCTWIDDEWQPCTFHFCITGVSDQSLRPSARVEFALLSTGRAAIAELELRTADGAARWNIQSASYTPPELVVAGRSNRESPLASMPRSAFSRRAPTLAPAAAVDPSVSAGDALIPRLRYLRTTVSADGGHDDAYDCFELVNPTEKTWRYRSNENQPSDPRMEARFGDAWSREATFTLCGAGLNRAPIAALPPGGRIEFRRPSVGRWSRCSIELYEEGVNVGTLVRSPEYLPNEHWFNGVSRRDRGASSRQADGNEWYVPFP